MKTSRIAWSEGDEDDMVFVMRGVARLEQLRRIIMALIWGIGVVALRD
jgi:hypothetical protein